MLHVQRLTTMTRVCTSLFFPQCSHMHFGHRGHIAGRDAAFDPAFSTKRAPPINYGVRIVPERTAFVVERFGKFNRVLDSGIHILIPLVCLLEDSLANLISLIHTIRGHYSARHA